MTTERKLTPHEAWSELCQVVEREFAADMQKLLRPLRRLIVKAYWRWGCNSADEYARHFMVYHCPPGMRRTDTGKMPDGRFLFAQIENIMDAKLDAKLIPLTKLTPVADYDVVNGVARKVEEEDDA